MRATFSSSISAPALCSALAIADSSTLRTSFAPFFGMKRRVCSASPTGLPRTVSATSRHFCGLMRAYFSLALTCISRLRSDDFLVARVHLEGARRRELAELVTHHVLGYEHRNVLAAVVNRDCETDHVGHDHRAPRPGLDRSPVVLLNRNAHLCREVQIDERSLLQ